MKVTGIILAGGKSKRMGEDKALMEFEDKLLIERAIELLLPTCETILISSNNSELKKFGHSVIPDEIPNCGPLGGIYSTLKKSSTNWNFIISVDSPFVTEELITFLISNIEKSDAVIPKHKKGLEPLIAMYHKNSLAKMEGALMAKDYKMQNFVRQINSEFIVVQGFIESDPRIFKNLNSQEDILDASV